jgi:nitrous-oxide reductase
MLHPRVAKVDLDTFRTGQILWLPNVNGGISSLHVNPDTSLLVAGFEHGQFPDPAIIKHLGTEVDAIKGPYVGGFAGIAAGSEGTMRNAWQVWTPWQHDAVRIGWGKSEGWLVTTSYNSERAVTTLGMLGKEEDYLFFWNLASIEQAVAEGKYVTTKQAPDVPVISWHDVEGYVTSVPVNPSGVDISPTGKYVFSGGKATAQVAVMDFEKIVAAIGAHQFDEETFDLPILTPEAVRATTLELGINPTRVEFDDQGFAYIGSFVDSVTWKVALGEPYTNEHGTEPWQVVDTLPSHYGIIHPLVPGGDTAQPYGRYLIAINKLAKNTFLPHGPLHTENHELYNIAQNPGQLIDQMPLGPETHAAQAIPVELLAPQTTTAYPPPNVPEEPRVEYDYDAEEVRVYMDVVRSFFDPEWVTVPQGWRVNIHMTSLEQALDISHGLGIDGYNVAVSLDPGEVREVEFIANQSGVYWFYCLWYCSELHKEMRGRIIVIPPDEWSPEMEWTNDV